MQTRTKESRKRLQSLILLTAFTCVLLIVSTYAWFTSQKDVNVSNIRAKVEVAEGLKISLDAANWTQVLDLETATDGQVSDLLVAKGGEVTRGGETKTVTYGPYAGADNHVPSEFLPVSTSGEPIAVGTTEELAMSTGSYADKILSTIQQADESLTDVSNPKYAGYFAFDMFLMNTSKTGVTEDTLQLNSDAAAWVLADGEDIIDTATYKGDAGSGLQNTIRVAFARYGQGTTTGMTAGTDYVMATEDDVDTILSTTGGMGIESVSIWEPNSDTHVQKILDNVAPLFTTVTSPVTALTGNAFNTRTVKSGVTSLADVYDWSTGNTDLLEPQTVKTTARPVSAGGFAPYTTEGVKDMTDINGNDFTIAANSITKYRVYVYIEGQDPDCDNTASLGGGIEVNIGLTKTETEGTMTRYKEVTGDTTRSDYTAPTP